VYIYPKTKFRLKGHSKLVIIDRDGCLNKLSTKNKYVSKSGELEIYPDVNEFIERVLKNGWNLCVVSNQQCIGLNITSLRQVISMHKKIFNLKRIYRNNIKLYLCPHIENSCECRKPSPKMLIRALNDYGVSVNNAVFIGDSITDCKAAKSIDLGFIHLNRPDNEIKTVFTADVEVSDLKSLINLLENRFS
jgi:D-glycero-D-manno-heptose 1,7-bisphosphate phosphatase